MMKIVPMGVMMDATLPSSSGQDTRFSFWRHGFDSRWECHRFSPPAIKATKNNHPHYNQKCCGPFGKFDFVAASLIPHAKSTRKTQHKINQKSALGNHKPETQAARILVYPSQRRGLNRPHYNQNSAVINQKPKKIPAPEPRRVF